MQRAFVTGGSGFLGQRVIAALAARGLPVAALARSAAAVRTVQAAGATAVEGDLGDADALRAGMRGCDLVVHSAALAKQHGALAEFLTINVDGTRAVLAAAREAGVARVVHVSTEAVLADGKPILRADELRPRAAAPVGPYPRTKALAEAAAVEAGAIVVRPRFIWGRGDTNVLAEMVETVKAGRWAWFSGGRYLTSTCHVANVVEGILRAAERGAPGEIYFLTDGEPVEFRDFVTRMLATQGVAAGTRSVPRWVAHALATLTAWMARPPVTKMALALASHEVTVDDAKARRELGYRGEMTIERGLAEMQS